VSCKTPSQMLFQSTSPTGLLSPSDHLRVCCSLGQAMFAQRASEMISTCASKCYKQLAATTRRIAACNRYKPYLVLLCPCRPAVTPEQVLSFAPLPKPVPLQVSRRRDVCTAAAAAAASTCSPATPVAAPVEH
jgi:hypothetical protein